MAGVRMSVDVDPDLCIGSMECNRIARQAFRLDEARGVSTALDSASQVDPETLAAAARSCPTQAITLVYEDASVGESDR
jgi:ferredoxin